MRIIIAGFGMKIPLGKRGENLAVQVQIPVVREWKAQYGEGTFQLVNKRPEEDIVYACVLDWDDTNVMWNITNTEVAIVGEGECELQYYVDDVLAKSYSWKTRIIDTLYDDGATPPEPWESWIEQVLQAGSEAQESALESKGYAEASQASATQAAGYASDAQASAQLATQKATEAAQSAQNAANYANQAQTSANNAAISATAAQAAATSMSFATLGMDENGHLVVYRAERLGVMQFALNYNSGDLEVTI